MVHGTDRRRRVAVALVGLASVALSVPGATGALSVAPTSGGSTAPIPRYVEETKRSGIDHVYKGDFAYFTGGGVAAFDCDGDGLAELYFAGGSGRAALYHNDSSVGGPLRFTRLKDAATDLPAVTGAYPLDVDSDGITDLAVLRDGENVLLRGLGDCRFERANEAWTFDGGDSLTMAFSATWEPNAAMPTLAFGNYIDTSPGVAFEDMCLHNELVRPEANGSGYAASIPLDPSYCALSMLFSDWDRSGRIDLRVSNDRQYYLPDEGGEQLWKVVPGEAPRLYSADDGWLPLQLNGMGIASYDLTGDGHPEVYLTSQGPNWLGSNAETPDRPTYRDISLDRGVMSTNPTDDKSLPSTSWHDEFQDVNNDGLIDLFVTKGNVDAMSDYAMKDPNVLFLGQPDGTFIDKAEAAHVVSNARGRGGALVDLNNDGLLDMVVANRSAKAQVWRNIGTGTPKQPEPMGDWLSVRLSESGPNRDGIGAWIEVRVGGKVQTREVTIGGGHAGGQLGPAHFGLGDGADAAGVEVRVQWPHHEWGPWMAASADTSIEVVRGMPAVQGSEPSDH